MSDWAPVCSPQLSHTPSSPHPNAWLPGPCPQSQTLVHSSQPPALKIPDICYLPYFMVRFFFILGPCKHRGCVIFEGGVYVKNIVIYLWWSTQALNKCIFHGKMRKAFLMLQGKREVSKLDLYKLAQVLRVV